MSSELVGANLFEIAQFSNVPYIRFRVSTVEGGDLSGGATVKFRMMRSDGVLVVESPAVIDGDNDAHYEWQAGDTDSFGTFWWQAEATLSNGKILNGPMPWGQINITPAVRSGIVSSP